MATYYWRGGAGTWDATTTTNWSTTSGGLGGAGPPTSADNVIFNTLSNATAYAVTIGTDAVCLDVTIAGPAAGNVTITSSATSVINVFGSWTNAATGVAFTTTNGAAITFSATTTGKTITTNNVALGIMALNINGVGGGWTFGSNYTSTGTIFSIAGSYSTANFAFSVATLTFQGSGVRSVSLGSSAITCTAATGINASNTANLTFNAGTSTISLSNANPTINGGGLTYNIVNLTSTALGTSTIQGANTFATLNQSSPTVTLRAVVLSANQTITGTLTLGAANTAVLRVLVRSDVIGTQRTLTVATIATLADVDFQDTVAAGASGTWSGTRLGNCTNNSNITFGAGKTVYWNLAGAQNWNATGWATSSGGTPAVNNFPLAQDTAVFDDTGSVTGIITINTIWNIGTLNITKTGAMTLASGTQTPRIFGSVTLQSATVTTGTGAYSYSAYGVSSTFTSNGATFTPPLTVSAPTGTLTLGSAFTQPSTVTTTLTAGTLNLSSYTLSTGLFSTNTSNVTALAFGTATINLSGVGTIWVGSTNCTVTGTPQVICTDSSSGARTLNTGLVSEANAISFRVTAGTGTFSMTSANTSVLNLDFTDGVNPTGFGGSLSAQFNNVYGNFKASTNMSQTAGTGTLSFLATSGTKTVTTAGVTFDRPFNFAGIGGTWQLQDALTLGDTRTLALNGGTLNLNNYTATAGIFSGSAATTRTLAMGTGKIVVTGSGATVCSTNTATGLTVTGSKRIELAYSGSVGQRAISGPTSGGGGIEGVNLLDYFITAGTDIVNFNGARSYGTIDFSNGGTSTFTTPGSWLVGAVNMYGDLILNPTMGITGSTVNVEMKATSGTKTITSAGQTMDFGLNINGLGGTFACSDALTLNSTRALSLLNGTLQLKAGVTSTVGSFVTSGTTQKFLQSTLSETQATISQASGTVDVTYLTIQDSNATGGATFNAYVSNFNVDSGNNTGWNGLSISDFAIGDVGSVTYSLTINLTGVAGIGAVGTVGLGATFGLTGNAATGNVGTPVAVYWKPINTEQTPSWTQINTQN